MAIGFQLRRYFIDWLHHARGTPGLSLDSGLDVKLIVYTYSDLQCSVCARDSAENSW